MVHPAPESTWFRAGSHPENVRRRTARRRWPPDRLPPGAPPPLSVREHTQAFLDWLQAHDKVPGNEVPVSILEHVLYWDFLRDTGSADEVLEGGVRHPRTRLPGVEKYQADWRDPTGAGGTPIVVKVRKRRRAKVVQLAERREAS